MIKVIIIIIAILPHLRDTLGIELHDLHQYCHRHGHHHDFPDRQDGHDHHHGCPNLSDKLCGGMSGGGKE